MEVELTWVFAAAVGGTAKPGSYDGRSDRAAEHYRAAGVDSGSRANFYRPIGVKAHCQRR